MSIGFILQARMDSSRLPKKALMQLNDLSVIENCFNILKESALNVGVPILATTNRLLDDPLVNLAHEYQIEVFRGDTNNVLNRFYEAAKKYDLTTISRLTGDNPFIVSKMQKALIKTKELDGEEACIVTTRNTGLPTGLDFEAFNKGALELAHAEAFDDNDLEHVTTFMYKDNRVNKIVKKVELKNIVSCNYSIDTLVDLQNARKLAKETQLTMSILN
ncbi:hypothetical protein EBV26_20350 [bacterium]|jgi:spore coat polysaccharide biosynthesis protein SpsF (cytidylyltransferase family)|nr:hypothetical protein [bacterium]